MFGFGNSGGSYVPPVTSGFGYGGSYGPAGGSFVPPAMGSFVPPAITGYGGGLSSSFVPPTMVGCGAGYGGFGGFGYDAPDRIHAVKEHAQQTIQHRCDNARGMTQAQAAAREHAIDRSADVQLQMHQLQVQARREQEKLDVRNKFQQANAGIDRAQTGALTQADQRAAQLTAQANQHMTQMQLQIHQRDVVASAHAQHHSAMTSYGGCGGYGDGLGLGGGYAGLGGYGGMGGFGMGGAGFGLGAGYGLGAGGAYSGLGGYGNALGGYGGYGGSTQLGGYGAGMAF